MEQKWPSCLAILRHGQSARNVAKDLAKATGEHSFDVGLRDLETPLAMRGLPLVSSNQCLLLACKPNILF